MIVGENDGEWLGDTEGLETEGELLGDVVIVGESDGLKVFVGESDGE